MIEILIALALTFCGIVVTFLFVHFVISKELQVGFYVLSLMFAVKSFLMMVGSE